jgi:hypothetical protein
MADGALGVSAADIALSVTGIAGPGGATATKPVGLVFIGAARRGGTLLVERHVFGGDRAAIRNASVSVAFRLARTLAGCRSRYRCANDEHGRIGMTAGTIGTGRRATMTPRPGSGASPRMCSPSTPPMTSGTRLRRD